MDGFAGPQLAEVTSSHQEIPAMTTPPNTRRVYSARRLSVYDVAAATFLHVRGHAVEYVTFNPNGKPIFFFGDEARRTHEEYVAAREHVMALVDRAQRSASARAAR
jgi:hypothetical protein